MRQTQVYLSTRFLHRIRTTINNLAKEHQHQLVCRSTIKLAVNIMANNNKLMNVILMRLPSITSSSISNAISLKMITFSRNHTTKDSNKANTSKMATIILSTTSKCDMEEAIIKAIMISMTTNATKLLDLVEVKICHLTRILIMVSPIYNRQTSISLKTSRTITPTTMMMIR